MARNKEIRATRGDDYDGLIVRWLDSERVPIPIASAKLQVRATPQSSRVLLELTETDGLDLSVLGEINIVGLTQDRLTTPYRGLWDLEAVATSGKRKTLLRGEFVIEEDVTHA
jgi:hypothetical protein